jgi:hypothetical protein
LDIVWAHPLRKDHHSNVTRNIIRAEEKETMPSLSAMVREAKKGSKQPAPKKPTSRAPLPSIYKSNEKITDSDLGSDTESDSESDTDEEPTRAAPPLTVINGGNGHKKAVSPSSTSDSESESESDSGDEDTSGSSSSEEESDKEDVESEDEILPLKPTAAVVSPEYVSLIRYIGLRLTTIIEEQPKMQQSLLSLPLQPILYTYLPQALNRFEPARLRKPQLPRCSETKISRANRFGT